MPDELTKENIEAEEIELDQYLVFMSNMQEFGFSAVRIREISSVLETTPVPNAPRYIEGIVNLRGKLASVINFRKKFGFQDKEMDEDTRLIIVEHKGYPVSILVDSVQEVIKIPDDKVQSLSESTVTSVSGEFITGVGLLDIRLIILMDLDAVLSKTELMDGDDLKQTIRKVQEMKPLAKVHEKLQKNN
jgi:purine-binding chemotaxis protein CheW